ncbi:MAG TPA: ribonuclease HI family protein [Microlunatus sp.]|nr:ribonuclease HI family protein [Microlunatus sp.]
MTVIAAADGSALGNPGPAGWGWYVDPDRWASGGWPHGTNNMGELTAVLDLLQQTAELDDDLLIYCDSTYVINSITKWMPGWKRKNWRKGDGKPVQNVEIMKAIDAAMQGRRVRFEWVKGHAGHELNEEADRLANTAALAFSQGRQPDRGPGIGGPVRTADTHGAFRPTPKPEPEADLFTLEAETEPTDEERVIALERELLTDDVRGDPATVAARLHPDWAEIGRSGRLWDRDELLATIAPLTEPVTLDVVSTSRLTDDVILLVWRAAGDARTTLRSSLWVRTGGDWRQRFQQGTDES